MLFRVYRAAERSPVGRPFRNPMTRIRNDGLLLDVETIRAEVEPLRDRSI